MACDATWDRMTFDGAGSADVMCDELSYGSVIHHVVGISHSVPWWEQSREGRRQKAQQMLPHQLEVVKSKHNGRR